MISGRVEGLRELERSLEKLEKRATRRAVGRRALKKAGEPLAESMRQLAPVDKGNLKNNIAVSTRASGGDAGKVAFGRVLQSGGSRAEAVAALREANRGSASLVQMFVGPTRIPQAIFQEFGTVNHGPQPFVRPAWDKGKNQVLEDIGKELKKEIDKSIERQAARAARLAARG